MSSIIQVKGKWRAQVRRKGHAVYTKTFPSKALAEKWARGVEAEIDAGATPSVQSVALSYTVAMMISDYRKLRDARPISDSSTEHYTLKMLSDLLGHLEVSRLSVDDLVAFAQARSDSGAGQYTINMDIGKLGTVIRMVGSLKRVDMGDVVSKARPLLSHLGLIGGGGRRERRPNEDELEAIISHLKDVRGQVYADVVRFAVLTAMRRGEIVKLKWSDLDEAKKLVLVRDRKDPRQKVGNDQWVPLLGEAWDLVQRQPKGDRIFPVHEQTLSKYFTWACRDLSIPDLHFHDLRHDGISRLFEQGYRIEQVAVVSGHKTWTHLKRYVQLRPEDLHNGPH